LRRNQLLSSHRRGTQLLSVVSNVAHLAAGTRKDLWSELSVEDFGNLLVQEVFDTAIGRGNGTGVIAMARILQVHHHIALYRMPIEDAVVGAMKSIKERSQAVWLMKEWHEDKDVKISKRFMVL
jgi:lysozyme family protein